jgi:hypothetical protein
MRPCDSSIVVLAALVLAPRLAQGQGGNAQAQFDYGLTEMEAGRYESGCAALGESYRIDPHPGVLFTLAECENRWGKIASALTHYGAYLDLFDHMSLQQQGLQRGRDKVATAQRDRLRSDVPELTIALPPDAPAGTTLERDGVALGKPSLGVALPVDPGNHEIVARTPDGATHGTTFALARGEHRALIVDLSAPSRSPVSPLPWVAPRPSARMPADRRQAAVSPMRIGAWIAGAFGVAGLAVGGVAGAMVLGDKSSIDAHCRADFACDPIGMDASRRANTLGIVSDVGFAVGALGIGTAIVLFLAPRYIHSPPVATQRWRPLGRIDAHGGIVGLGGAW